MKRKDAIFTTALILLAIKTVYNLIAETVSTQPLACFMFVLTFILCCESCSKHFFNGEFHKWLNETI